MILTYSSCNNEELTMAEGEGKKKRDCRRFSDLARVHRVQDAPSPVKPLLNQGYCPSCGE